MVVFVGVGFCLCFLLGLVLVGFLFYPFVGGGKGGGPSRLRLKLESLGSPDRWGVSEVGGFVDFSFFWEGGEQRVRVDVRCCNVEYRLGGRLFSSCVVWVDGVIVDYWFLDGDRVRWVDAVSFVWSDEVEAVRLGFYGRWLEFVEERDGVRGLFYDIEG